MTIPTIKLYGSPNCHKTRFYKDFLSKRALPFQFFDVIQNEKAAEELRSLYSNRKLNFPTITVGHKKLRNPSINELEKWLKN